MNQAEDSRALIYHESMKGESENKRWILNDFNVFNQ